MVAIVIAFLISASINALIIRHEYFNNNAISDSDTSSVQKFHVIPVPRVGGIGILCGLLIGLGSKLVSEPSTVKLGLFLIFSSAPAFIGGIIEDFTKIIKPSIRFSAIVVSALLGLCLLDARIIRVDFNNFDYALKFDLVSIILTCVAVAGVTNSFNLIDGYNGLSSTVAIIILVVIAYVAIQVGDRSIEVSAYVIAASIFGFLIWNYPAGFIFLGDGGAYLIGFLIAELLILLVYRNHTVSAWFPILLLSYPVSETLFSIFRRIVFAKKNPSLPDAAHLHHLIYRRLVRWAVGSSSSNDKVVRNALTAPYLWILTSITAFPSVLLWDKTNLLIILSVIFILFYLWLYRLLYIRKFPKWVIIRR